MQKTINISLGGLSFILEEDAYSRLETYLHSVRQHFSSFKEANEIVGDIESRFAEQFTAKAGNGNSLVMKPPKMAVIIQRQQANNRKANGCIVTAKTL